MEQNRQIFNALRMEKAVTVITIGLIELVAALNILIALVMMVMEKYRDIAVLMSMGARREQIRRIFVYQGLLIGTVGTAIGLAAGYTLCLPGEPLSLDAAGRRGLLAQLRAVRTALGGRPVDRRGRHPGQLPGHAVSLPQRHPHRSRRSAALRITLYRPQYPVLYSAQPQSSGDDASLLIRRPGMMRTCAGSLGLRMAKLRPAVIGSGGLRSR